MRTRNMFTALALTLGMTCLPGCGDDNYAFLGGPEIGGQSVGATSEVAGVTAQSGDAALANDVVTEAPTTVRYTKSRNRRPPRESRQRRQQYRSIAAPIQTVSAPVYADTGTIFYAAGAPVSPAVDYVPAVVIGPDGSSFSSTTVGTPVLSGPVLTAPVATAPRRVAPTRQTVVVETPVLAPPEVVRVPGKIVTTNVLGYPQEARVTYRRGRGPRRVQRTTRVVQAPAPSAVAAVQTESYVPATVVTEAAGESTFAISDTPAITSTEVYNIRDVDEDVSTEPKYSMYIASADGTAETAAVDAPAVQEKPVPEYYKYLVDPNDSSQGSASVVQAEYTGPVVSTPIPDGTSYIAYDVYEPSTGTPQVNYWQADPSAMQATVQQAMAPAPMPVYDPMAEPLTDPYASAYVQPESLIPGGMYQAGVSGGPLPVIQPVVIQPIIQPVIQAAGLQQVMGMPAGFPVQYYEAVPGLEGLAPMQAPTAMIMPAYPVGYQYPSVNTAVCAPGQNMSECFTLTDYQLQNSAVYTPTAQGPLDFQAPPAAPAPVVEARAAEVPAEPTASVMPESPVASAIVMRPPTAPTAPTVQPAAPVVVAPAVTEPVPLPPPAEALSSKYAGLPEPTQPSAPMRPEVTPPSVTMPPPLGSRDNIPPVPAASVIESALEAMTAEDAPPYLK